MNCLVLSHNMYPHDIVTWQEAFVLVYFKHYQEGGRKPRATILASFEEWEQNGTLWSMPAVIRLERKHARNGRGDLRYSKSRVFLRDQHTCQYCSVRHSKEQLTQDHVKPRQQGGKTDWDNILTACKPCNHRKANRTPEQAAMRPLSKPRKPESLGSPIMARLLDMRYIPEEWKPFLPKEVTEKAP
jgi:5-methylcytosine-specific restriction endonuclease McrA